MSQALPRAAAVAIIAASLTAAGCGGTVVDEAKLEAATHDSLERSFREKIMNVDCPSDLSVDPGTTFTCDVSFQDGTQRAAELEIRNEDADISIVGLKTDP